MLSVTVDSVKLLVNKGSSVLQVCEFIKKEIPRFCYHKELFVAGNCRMCLVEIEKFPKPIVSCSMPAGDGMVIYTNTPLVRKARESVLEFLLINHPLDCPICDQGGECDLQDQTFIFGSDRTRFYKKNKRVVEDKYFNIIIKTVMTRCIHCTRCVRFIEEIAGESILGTSGRGVNTEIGFYINHILKSELSGNIIDLCPVGALTSKPYAFVARPWDLTSYYSIDLNDAMGVNIKIDIFNNEIVRITPKLCSQINDTWISDKARYFFDGLKIQRLSSFLFNQTPHEKNSILNFFLFLNTVSLLKNYKNFGFRFICDNDLDLETLSAIQNLSFSLGFESIQTISSTTINTDFESNYKFSGNFDNVEKNDVILMLSSNLRYELPNLNIKFKKAFTEKNTDIYYTGVYFKNTYSMTNIGITNTVLKQIAEGKHKLSRKLIKAKNPQLFVGLEQNLDVKSLFCLVNTINSYVSQKNIINMISKSNSSINQMEFGISSYKPKKCGDFLYLFNINKNNTYLLKELLNSRFSIYHGYLGNPYTQQANLILPHLNLYQKEGSYLNLMGKKQISKKVINPQFNSYLCFYDIVLFLKKTFYFKNKMTFYQFHLTHKFSNRETYLFLPLAQKNKYVSRLKYEKQVLNFSFKNFYKTNIISSNSLIMSKLTKQNQILKNFI